MSSFCEIVFMLVRATKIFVHFFSFLSEKKLTEQDEPPYWSVLQFKPTFLFGILTRSMCCSVGTYCLFSLSCVLLWSLQVIHLLLPVTNVENRDQPVQRLLEVTGWGRGRVPASCTRFSLMRVTVPSRHCQWPGLWLWWARPKRPYCTSLLASTDLCCSHHGSTER